jgi:hypothetical protein
MKLSYCLLSNISHRLLEREMSTAWANDGNRKNFRWFRRGWGDWSFEINKDLSNFSIGENRDDIGLPVTPIPPSPP